MHSNSLDMLQRKEMKEMRAHLEFNLVQFAAQSLVELEDVVHGVVSPPRAPPHLLGILHPAPNQ